MTRQLETAGSLTTKCQPMTTDCPNGSTSIPGTPDPWWSAGAMKAIEQLANTGLNFTAAELADLGVAEPDHPCRWGSLFAAAKAQGIIVKVGYGPSQRVGRNGGVAAIWTGATSLNAETAEDKS